MPSAKFRAFSCAHDISVHPYGKIRATAASCTTKISRMLRKPEGDSNFAEPDNLVGNSKQEPCHPTVKVEKIDAERQIKSVPIKKQEIDTGLSKAANASHLTEAYKGAQVNAAFIVELDLRAVDAWEESKKAGVESEIKRFEEQQLLEKAKFLENMKNHLDLVYEEGEQKRTKIESKYKA